MANNNVIAGDKEPIQVELEIERAIGQPPRIVKTYRGERSQVENAFALLASNANRAMLRTNGSTAVAEISSQSLIGEAGYDPNSPRVEDLSYRADQVQISLFDSPYFSAIDEIAIANIQSTGDAILAVKTVGYDGYLERKALRDGLIASYNFLDPTWTPIVTTGLDFYVGKVQNPVIFLPVLTWRRIYVDESSIQLSCATMGKVFSTASLPIPSDLLSRIDTPAVSRTLSLRASHGFGWLKSVSFDVTSDGGIELIETYTYGSYPVPFYPDSTWDSQA